MTPERSDFIAKYCSGNGLPFMQAMNNISADFHYRYIYTPNLEECVMWHQENDSRVESMRGREVDVVPDMGGFEMLGKFYPYKTQKRICTKCNEQYGAHWEYEWLCGTCFGNWLRLRNKVWDVDNKNRLQLLAASKPITKPVQLEMF